MGLLSLIDGLKHNKKKNWHDCYASAKCQAAAHTLSGINHLFQPLCETLSEAVAFYVDGFQIVIKMKGYNISKLSDQNSSRERHTWSSATFPSSHLKSNFTSRVRGKLGHTLTAWGTHSSLQFDISFRQQELEHICHTDMREQVRTSRQDSKYSLTTWEQNQDGRSVDYKRWLKEAH